jgi:multiple sugar transport system ATP-binding protein
MVFQNYALYPHMDVAQNMGFALKLAKVPKQEIERRVRDAAKILDLEPYLDRKPRQLSGGQRQRVAMGRAIVREPRVFLMDEPLSNLDAKLRVATRAEIAALQRRLGITTVYVTHDQVEAMTMGDRVAVMKDGVLQQCDTPRALYDDPVNAFVAGFIGSPPMNLIDAVVTPDGIRVGSAVVASPEGLPTEPGSPLTVGLRPEAMRLTGDGEGIPATVNLVEELGAEAFVHASLLADDTPGGLPSGNVVARVEPQLAPAKGERISFHTAPGSMLFFDADSGSRIRTTLAATGSSSR